MLIADSGNDRLQVMTSDFRFSVVRVDTPLVQPRTAVFHKKMLFVVCNMDADRSAVHC